jgi:aspartate/methionine/tyrosine aminotransferase
MWFCQPNNPTGLYIPTDELSRVIELARRHDAYVVLDESCDNYRFISHYALPKNISDSHVIRIRTFSKDPNFAGYRLGYILASPVVLDRIKRIAPIHYGNPTVMATRAITTELRIRNRKLHDADHEQVTAENFQLMKQSRDFLHERLAAWDHVEEVILPEACYYMYARFRYPGGSQALFTRLVAEENLNVVPGGVFGAPDDQAWLRICFARTRDVLVDGLERLRRVVESRG